LLRFYDNIPEDSVMKRNRLASGFVGLLGAIALVVSASAYAGLGKAEIGAPMPDFKLTDYAGKTHQLSDYAGKVVVIDFLSKDCPWSRGAAPAIAEVAKSYAGKDVVFIGINSNQGTTADAMAKYAESGSIPYPIAVDAQNKYADTVGATRTPEIYVVDREGKLAYHGAYDNRKSPEQIGDVNYTKDAIDAVLAGKPVAKTEISAWGCTINRAPKNVG
jgi:thiol-disulfide isomerase/thioredoxin